MAQPRFLAFLTDFLFFFPFTGLAKSGLTGSFFVASRGNSCAGCKFFLLLRSSRYPLSPKSSLHSRFHQARWRIHCSPGHLYRKACGSSDLAQLMLILRHDLRHERPDMVPISLPCLSGCPLGLLRLSNGMVLVMYLTQGPTPKLCILRSTGTSRDLIVSSCR